MTNEDLLAELNAKLASGELTRQQVMGSLAIGETAPRESKASLSLTKILYVLGACVAVLGIIFFVAQIWEDIGSFGRILITFGLGILLAAIGSFLLERRPETYLGQVFHAIAGFLIPGGALVVLSEVSSGLDSLWPVCITIGAVFLFYLLLDLYHKRDVLTFFAIANGTAFVYLLIGAMYDDPLYRLGDVYAYVTMAIGLSYLFLAESFQGGRNKRLTGVLHFFGTVGFLGAAFSRVFDSTAWEFLYFLIAVGAMALAVRVRSRSMLVLGTLFLVAHFIYITSEYFADSIGWPLALIVIGFVIIGLGYASITLNKKYIKGDAQ